MPAFVGSEKAILESLYQNKAPTNFSGFLALLTGVPTKQKKATKTEVWAKEEPVKTAWAAYTRFKLGVGASEGELELVESEAGLTYLTNKAAIVFPTTAAMAGSVTVEYVAVWDVATLSEVGNPISYAALEAPLTINKALSEVSIAAKVLKLGAE